MTTTLISLGGRCGAVAVLQRCLRDPISGPSVTNLLDRFLPSNIIQRLRSDANPQETLSTFDGESETPALVWDGAMRKTLRAALALELEAYRSNSDEEDGHAWAPPWDFKVRMGENGRD